MNLKLQDLEYVRIFAKQEAQKTHKDQVIYESTERRYKIYKFRPVDKWSGKVITVVRYAPKNKRGKVLRNNGNGEFRPVKSKARGRSKREKID